MFSFLENTRIGARISLALVLPVVGMLIFSGMTNEIRSAANASFIMLLVVTLALLAITAFWSPLSSAVLANRSAEEASTNVQTVASAAEELSSSISEIARNVEQASAGTADVTTNIASVNTAADETGQAANDVLAAAGTLSMQSERLSSEVNAFLKGLQNT